MQVKLLNLSMVISRSLLDFVINSIKVLWIFPNSSLVQSSSIRLICFDFRVDVNILLVLNLFDIDFGKLQLLKLSL